ADGKRVYYVTNVGVFRLGEQGLELIWLMPGVDLERDVIGQCGARFRVADPLRRVDEAVVSGRGFVLGWDAEPGPAAA
ncbi:MAG: 3-oxoacid CoA-transferase, partial [Gammaproteobacteria bacterium]